MKKISFLFLLLCASLGMFAQSISRVEPLSWWTDMRCPLTLMMYGSDLQDASVSIARIEGKRQIPTTGLVLRGQHNADSKNYLFLDLDVREAGKYVISLKKGRKVVKYTYEIAERRPGSADRKSFTSADVVYLIMSDRFVDGDASNNSTDNTLEKCNKDNLDGRWGGDIQGIINSLDHIKRLGATTIWPTPLLLDNEQAWSYHGYACSDYYHIDPRFGSNEQYRDMVAAAHANGLKFLMDIVTNHCGTAHWWMQDLPYQDWIHQFPTFTRTINQFTTAYDVNASKIDRKMSDEGWFDTHMPDMNLNNPDLLQYFKQWAIWWIEYADLDGLRVDTYPYNEKEPMSEWCKAVRTEYPNINIVGECWTRPANAISYWQADAANYDGFNSNLPSVMDFPLCEAIRGAMEGGRGGWGAGMNRVYDALTQDYLYADVNKLLIFADNHDMDRITDVVKDKDFRRAKLAAAILATMRGIPQLFAGNEYGQLSADMSRGHSGLRRPLKPEAEWTAEEKDMFDYQSSLFQWRLTEPIIHSGKTMHFHPENNVYTYVRYTDEGAVLVMLNASEDQQEVSMERFAEILSCYQSTGKDVLTGKAFQTTGMASLAPLSATIVRLNK